MPQVKDFSSREDKLAAGLVQLAQAPSQVQALTCVHSGLFELPVPARQQPTSRRALTKWVSDRGLVCETPPFYFILMLLASILTTASAYVVRQLSPQLLILDRVWTVYVSGPPGSQLITALYTLVVAQRRRHGSTAIRICR